MKNIIIFNEEALIGFLKLGVGFGYGDGRGYGGSDCDDFLKKYGQ